MMGNLEQILDLHYDGKYRLFGYDHRSSTFRHIDVTVKLYNTDNNYPFDARRLDIHISGTEQDFQNPDFVTQQVMAELDRLDPRNLKHNDVLKDLCFE